MHIQICAWMLWTFPNELDLFSTFGNIVPQIRLKTAGPTLALVLFLTYVIANTGVNSKQERANVEICYGENGKLSIYAKLNYRS
jgi:hypothetical protein